MLSNTPSSTPPLPSRHPVSLPPPIHTPRRLPEPVVSSEPSAGGGASPTSWPKDIAPTWIHASAVGRPRASRAAATARTTVLFPAPAGPTSAGAPAVWCSSARCRRTAALICLEEKQTRAKSRRLRGEGGKAQARREVEVCHREVLRTQHHQTAAENQACGDAFGNALSFREGKLRK